MATQRLKDNKENETKDTTRLKAEWTELEYTLDSSPHSGKDG